uniref:Uncharacterized protein n=1 Tax=Rangifer tarandus platyrhynchus TaxID=3082113 RepID=A0ACB0ESR5_RANTA|nr:unnamed protein product [Rangifer tarandus platyrhynchus]
MTTASPRSRRNYQQDSEAAINRQIRLQLCASHVYLSVTSEAAESSFRKKPDRDDRENGLDAMECALRLEGRVRQPLLELHRLATGKSGPHLCDLAETHYPSEQVGAIRALGDRITNLRQLGAPGSGVAEHLLTSTAWDTVRAKPQDGGPQPRGDFPGHPGSAGLFGLPSPFLNS